MFSKSHMEMDSNVDVDSSVDGSIGILKFCASDLKCELNAASKTLLIFVEKFQAIVSDLKFQLGCYVGKLDLGPMFQFSM